MTRDLRSLSCSSSFPSSEKVQGNGGPRLPLRPIPCRQPLVPGERGGEEEEEEEEDQEEEVFFLLLLLLLLFAQYHVYHVDSHWFPEEIEEELIRNLKRARRFQEGGGNRKRERRDCAALRAARADRPTCEVS